MEEMFSVLRDFLSQFPTVTMILSITGVLVYSALIIVGLTPSKKDDKYVADKRKNPIIDAVVKFFLSFSPIKNDKKEGKKKLSSAD